MFKFVVDGFGLHIDLF